MSSECEKITENSQKADKEMFEACPAENIRISLDNTR
jgi:hypothetical protein